MVHPFLRHCRPRITSYDTVPSILGYLDIEACFVGTLSYDTWDAMQNSHKSTPHNDIGKIKFLGTNHDGKNPCGV